MNVFEVATRIPGSGEHILGYDETGSHACYLIYGVLKAGEKGRELRPGKGHEEMVLVTKGDLVLTGQLTGTLRQGQAIHLRGEDSCHAENRGEGDAVYVIAGGHSASGHDH
jgi:hypothetical protein